MAVAGKIMLRPRGAYSSVEVYEILDIVTFNNKAWVCKLPSTIDVEPNEENSATWSLLISGAVGDAATLDGHDATYFAVADHGHTPEEVGAVPITGGTMTGGLAIQLDWGGYYLKDSSGRDGFFEKNTNSGAINLGNLKDTDNMQFITVAPETGDISDAIVINRVVNGESFTYKLYGEHNKISGTDHSHTAEEVGAVPITGGIMTGGLAVQQDWGGYYIKDSSGRDGFFEKNPETSAVSIGSLQDTDNAQVLTVMPETEALNNAIALSRTVNGEAITYKLYGEHNSPVVNYTVTLTADGWTGEGPYTQTVEVLGMLETDDPIAGVMLGDASTADDVEAIYDAWSMVDKITTTSDSITATCYSNKPSVDFTVKMKVVK